LRALALDKRIKKDQRGVTIRWRTTGGFAVVGFLGVGVAGLVAGFRIAAAFRWAMGSEFPDGLDMDMDSL